MEFEFTNGQKEALEAITAMVSVGKPGSTLLVSGSAGTGKTTILGVAAKRLAGVSIVAPTGKAAVRVMEATGLEASTIHMWLYHAKENPSTGEIEFTRKPLKDISVPASRTLMIDEASMVSRDLWLDIMEVCIPLGIRVIAIGDEFQLPPIVGHNEKPFSLLTLPNAVGKVRLTEITRQALESPIIRASQDLREGRVMDALTIHDIEVIKNSKLLEVALETYKKGGMVICHRNATRHKWNSLIRKELGKRKGVLEEDEPLLVLKNNYTTNLFNGEIVQFKQWDKMLDSKEEVYDRYNDKGAEITFGIAKVEGGYNPKLGICSLALEEVLGELDPEIGVSAIAMTSKRLFEGKMDGKLSHLHANLGYTMTCHKSQGSESNDVLVLIEDSVPIYTLEGRRWAYTAFTRAKSHLKIAYL